MATTMTQPAAQALRIQQEITIPAPPERIYQALTNSAKFAAVTGRPADIGTGEGAAFSLFGGYVEGRHIELIPNSRVVQAWRLKDWEPGVYSTVRFTLVADGGSTTLSVDQDGHPEEWHDHLSTNWPNFYLNPFAKAFARGLSGTYAVTDDFTIHATADVTMSPDRVFTALNTAELEHWWGSADTYRMTEWVADLRVGGLWSVAIRFADGNTLTAGGRFLEIDAPGKIVFTRKYDFDFPGLGRSETTVTYLLDSIEAGTRVTVLHTGFAGLSEPATHHVTGWERVLGWLEGYAKEQTR